MSANTLQAIGDRIRRARTAKGWRQEDLAEKAGLSRGSIANIEAGNQTPPIDKFLQLAQALEVPVAALVGEVPLALPPRVRVTPDGWVIRCDECGLVGPAPTEDAGKKERERHLREAHGA